MKRRDLKWRKRKQIKLVRRHLLRRKCLSPTMKTKQVWFPTWQHPKAWFHLFIPHRSISQPVEPTMCLQNTPAPIFQSRSYPQWLIPTWQVWIRSIPEHMTHNRVLEHFQMQTLFIRRKWSNKLRRLEMSVLKFQVCQRTSSKWDKRLTMLKSSSVWWMVTPEEWWHTWESQTTLLSTTTLMEKTCLMTFSCLVQQVKGLCSCTLTCLQETLIQLVTKQVLDSRNHWHTKEMLKSGRAIICWYKVTHLSLDPISKMAIG